MGVQAYVLARKGVLVSNPDVQNMTITQWMFEYHALRKKEETLFKSSFTALRKTLVSVLGLNLLRPTDANDIPKKFEDMTEEEQEQYMPLVSWVGHPEMLQNVSKQYDVERDLGVTVNPNAEYDRQVAAIDDGDMLPIIVPDTVGKHKDARTALQERLLVQPTIDVAGKV